MKKTEYYDHILTFSDEFGYGEEAKKTLADCFEKLCATEDNAFTKWINAYEASMNIAFADANREVAEYAESIGENVYVAQQALYVCFAKVLKVRYREKGYSDEIYFDSMSDLKWKLIECEKLYGIHGTFVAHWYARFFNMTRFALGRLQFEDISCPVDYDDGHGNSVHKGDRVINVHIPSAGHMDHALVEDAYRKAAEFYREYYGMEKIVFYCTSWLLFPHNREILSPNSNIIAFMNDFDIFNMGYYDNFNELWRFFYKKYDGDPDHLPNELSMQRGYIKWIKEGHKTGYGAGIYFYPCNKQ